MTNSKNDETFMINKLKKLKNIELPRDPYFAKRVPAIAQTTISKNKSVNRLKFSLVFSVALLLTLSTYLIILTNTDRAIFQANTYNPYSVQIELKDIADNVSHIEINLSKGVYFYSNLLDKQDKLNQLLLDKDIFKGKNYLPVVVRSDEGGLKVVNVSFLDSSNTLLFSKNLKINFK